MKNTTIRRKDNQTIAVLEHRSVSTQERAINGQGDIAWLRAGQGIGGLASLCIGTVVGVEVIFPFKISSDENFPASLMDLK